MNYSTDAKGQHAVRMSNSGGTGEAPRLRILHVSAHYPPNFVSGGTLVPQRLARAQRYLGHDVRVYAGYLDAQRDPLQAWTETDESGLSVRWIVTTPWIGWGDRTNYCNPAVEFDFQSCVREFVPDVVHFHSLQSLGAGLLSVAADAGARVIVTMHDFWWLCARQFLVDRDLVPCCLVVAAGVCECQVDRPYLVERRGYLFNELARADLILAPSRSAAAVFEANGVARERLRVNENGLADDRSTSVSVSGVAEGAESPRMPATDHVRFLFTGGANPMKGAQVLFAAARALRDLPGWTLDAFGFPQANEVLDDMPSSVRVLGQYAPSELDAVMSSHDVLVVPSLMRESHSLVTREALIRGLAVVCTDTLGPEEAVSHGVNGLVVPAGDANGLADAMTTLVKDRSLLSRLRASGPVGSVRTLTEQVTSLDALYHDVVDQHHTALPRDSEAEDGTIRSVLFVVGIEGAPLRYRAYLPAEALALRGISAEVRYYRDPSVVELADTADAVVLYRVPATEQVLQLIADIRRRPEPVPVLFDVDDLIFDPELRDEIPAMKLLEGAEADLWMQGVRRYRTTMELCDLFVGSTEELCRHATAVTGLPSARFPNGVGIRLSQASDIAVRRPRRPGPPRIGYLSGTNTHDHDWLEIEDAVIEVMGRHPEAELILGGHLNPSSQIEAVGTRVHRLPMVPWYELPELLRDLDINLAPLEPIGRFNEAKSAIKWLEAGLVGTPTIASPTEPFREVIVSGGNGVLAATHDAWLGAMDMLLTDGVGRRRMGSRARRDALVRYSPHSQADVYLNVLLQARAIRRACGPRVSSPEWTPTVVDEPYARTPLEPYALEVPAATRPLATRSLKLRAKNVLAASAEIYRSEGAREVLLRAARKGRRIARTTAVRLRARLRAINVPGQHR